MKTSLKNEPRGSPVIKVNNDELKVTTEADPYQTTKQFASWFYVSLQTTEWYIL